MNLNKEQEKQAFRGLLTRFVDDLKGYVSADDDQWTVKGFIDLFKNIYTISTDTKVISKILEIHLYPKVFEFAGEHNYKIVWADHQNYYPDLTFVKTDDDRVKFAVDLKTTYRDPKFPGHVNGFTLGSHGKYFTDRTSTKNIQYPYSEYLGHFCLGIIYSRVDFDDDYETKVLKVKEIDEEGDPRVIGSRSVTSVSNLKNIASVIRDFQFFVAEKWEIASDHQGSSNTANIGSITYIDDLIKGHGVFKDLGEEWFDEYWMNYGQFWKRQDGTSQQITKLRDYLAFRGEDADKAYRKMTKRKRKGQPVTEVEE